MIRILTNTYQVVDPLFGRRPRRIEMDMGCGKGALTLELARRFPDRLVLGTDIMLGRLRRVQKTVERNRLDNVELLRADNVQIASFLLPDNCLYRLHILCPDPWPKERHRARRLLSSEFVGRAQRLLAPGGILHVATDHEPYQEIFRQVIGASGLFAEAPDAIADVADIQTGFEKQWREQGKEVPHFGYRRRL